MLLFALMACGEDECHVEEVDVADDAPAGDLAYTAADVLAFVAGERAFFGDAPSTRGSDATLTVTRGEGSAVLSDATFIQRLDADDVNPLYHDYELQPLCADHLEVPVAARVAIPEMGVDVTVAGVAEALDQGAGVTLRTVWVSGSLPADTATLPHPPEGVDSATVFAAFEEGVLTRFALEWTVANTATDGTILEMNGFE